MLRFFKPLQVILISLFFATLIYAQTPIAGDRYFTGKVGFGGIIPTTQMDLAGDMLINSGSIRLGNTSDPNKVSHIVANPNYWSGFDVTGGGRFIYMVTPTQVASSNLVFTIEDNSTWTRNAEFRANGSAFFRGNLDVNGRVFSRIISTGTNITSIENQLSNGTETNLLHINPYGNHARVMINTNAPRIVDMNAGQFYLNTVGQIGICTNYIPAGYKLAVNGKIVVEEVLVKLRANWPDYVFLENYNPMSLGELETYIKENHALPGIPTEKEVKDNGVSLGEMQAKLLQKVEELTLYIISQDKKIEKLEKENSEIKNSLGRINTSNISE